MRLTCSQSKRRDWPAGRAFTLIELLVVVAIILVLAGLLLSSLSAARTRAKRHRALVEVNQITTGLRGFHSDVGHWPVFEYDGGVDYVVANYLALGYSPVQLTNFFLENADLPLTETAIRRLLTGYDRTIRYYLTLDKANLVTNTSLTVSNVPTVVLADPWGQPYYWRFDYDANDRIPNPFEPGTTNMVRASVLIWSAGPDGQSDTGGEKSALNRDNIRSW